MKIQWSRHVVKNIDELFHHDDMLAAPDLGIDITSDFNSGVLSFTPSEELRSRVYSSLYILESADGGDQGFLNSLFGDEVKRLAPEYNMIKRFPVHHPNLNNLEDVKVIHYVGDNPWEIHQKRADFTQLESLWEEYLESTEESRVGKE